MPETKPIEVRLIDVEGIHGLIEVLTDVVEQSVVIVETYEKSADYDVDFEGPMSELRERILVLNDYVDKHMHDE
jgi:hypothetical protein